MTKKDAKPDLLLDELLKDWDLLEDILGEHGLLKVFTKRLVDHVHIRPKCELSA